MFRCLLIFFFCLLSNSVFASENKSVYTDIDLDTCPLIDQAKPGDGEWAKWKCQGYNNIDVIVAEGDLRFSITFGSNDFGKSLSPFNTLGKKLEWRLKNTNKGWQPIATIVRYFTDGQGKKGQVLVVSKFDDRVTCHMAYIDALANKEANKMAQYVADKLSDKFTCGHDEALIVGKSGISPM